MDLTEQSFNPLYEQFQSQQETKVEELAFLNHHDGGNCTQKIADYFRNESATGQGGFDELTTISTACSSAANAIMLGAKLLETGEADIVVAGGSEALSRFHLNGFNSLMILDKKRCRPFNATRAGLNLGEGAAFVVLESESATRHQGKTPHAYLTGYGNACDAYHRTASSENGEGAFLAMKEALNMAHIEPEDIQYVNAHGTGTPNNDRANPNLSNGYLAKDALDFKYEIIYRTYYQRLGKHRGDHLSACHAASFHPSQSRLGKTDGKRYYSLHRHRKRKAGKCSLQFLWIWRK